MGQKGVASHSAIKNYASPVGPKYQNQNFFTENRIHDLQKGMDDD